MKRAKQLAPEWFRSPWQRAILQFVSGGNGILGQAMTPKQRAECDALVRTGALAWTPALNGHKLGAYHGHARIHNTREGYPATGAATMRLP